MLDRDLAELYGVETKYLKRQVRRNSMRFPIDFMFELTDKELKIWRSQYVTSNEDKMGLRYTLSLLQKMELHNCQQYLTEMGG